VLRSVGVTPDIFNLDTSWRCAVSLTLQPIYSQGKNLWNLLYGTGLEVMVMERIPVLAGDRTPVLYE